MRTKRYHHGDLKRTLIEVAEIELSQHGFEGLSLREVAKRAGVSHTAPYRHFADKSQLLSCLVLHGFQRLLENLEEAEWRCPDNLKLQLTSFAQFFVESVYRQPRKAHYMFSRPVHDSSDDFLADIKRDILLKLDELCQAAESRGEIPTSGTIATAYWSALVGLGVLISSSDPTLHGKSIEDLQILAEEVTNSLLS